MSDPRLTVAWVAWLAGLGVAMAAGVRSSDLLVASLVLGATAIACFAVARGDLALRIYIIGLAIPFAVAPLYRAGFDRDLATVWWLLAVWLAGWAVGVALTRRKRRPPKRLLFTPQRSDTAPFLIFAYIGLALQVVTFIRQGSQFSAQLNGVVDTGLNTILLAATPAAVAVAFWSSHVVSTRRLDFFRVASSLSLLAQTLLLLTSGFRAAAPGYLLTVWLLGKRCKQGRSEGTSIARLTVLLATMLFLFLFASNYRSDVAASLGRSSAGTVAPRLRDLPATVAQRLDYSVYLNQAVRRAEDPRAQAVVSPVTEVAGLIPRVLWPAKPPVYYGRDVAVVFFDAPPESNSAETITWLGDLYVQGGAPLILLAGAFFGLALSIALRILERPGILAIAAYYVVLAGALNTEAPLILATGHSLRIFGVLYGVHTVSRLLQRERSPRPLAVSPHPG